MSGYTLNLYITFFADICQHQRLTGLSIHGEAAPAAAVHGPSDAGRAGLGRAHKVCQQGTATVEQGVIGQEISVKLARYSFYA